MKRQHSSKEIQKGFTIIESLVAISLILIAVTTVFSIAQFGISTISAVRNRTMAMFLAQEAQEIVKNMKDSNLHKLSMGEDIEWLEGIVDGATSCGQGSPCGYDIYDQFEDEPVLFICEDDQADGNCGVRDNGRVVYQGDSGGTETGFLREIVIEETIPKYEARIQVTVSRPGTSFEPFKVTNVIYSWFAQES